MPLSTNGMDKKSKILLWVIGVLVVGAAGMTWYRTMTMRAFEVTSSEEAATAEELAASEDAGTPMEETMLSGSGETAGNPEDLIAQ